MTVTENAPHYTRRFWAKSEPRDGYPKNIRLLEHHLADIRACFEALLTKHSIGHLDPFTRLRRIRELARQWFLAAWQSSVQRLPLTPESQHHFLGLRALAARIGSNKEWFPFWDEPRDGYKECDAFLYEDLRYPERRGMTRTRGQVYAQWLAEQFHRRGPALLNIESVRLVSLQRTRAHRKLHSRHTERPDAVMRGELTVSDPDAFADMLSQDVGRHRAYEYGMLLLRPARR